MINTMVSRIFSLFALAFGLAAGSAIAQDTGAATRTAKSDFDVLMGTWVRPDGGYTLTIKGASPDGELDAVYANPQPLPFDQARASQNGNTINVFFHRID